MVLVGFIAVVGSVAVCGRKTTEAKGGRKEGRKEGWNGKQANKTKPARKTH